MFLGALHKGFQRRVTLKSLIAVSYTHLDVYKRQGQAEAIKRLHLPNGFGSKQVGYSTGFAAQNPRLDIRCSACLLYTSRCV